MKSVWALLAVCALCSACGGGLQKAPPKPPSVAQGLIVEGPTKTVLELGEQLIADADVLGVSIGTLDMRLGEACGSHRGDHWVLESKLGTAGVLRWFNKTQGSTTTLVDPVTLRPKESTTVVIDGDEWRRYHIQYGEGRYRFFYTKSNGQRDEGEEQSPDHEPIYDTQTAYLLLRTWQPKPQEQTYFYVTLGKDLWRSDVKYLGLKTIDTNDGQVKVRHVEGVAHRINMKPGDEYTPRDLSMWLSDDEKRIPYKVVGDSSLGSVHFDLQQRNLLETCQQANADQLLQETQIAQNDETIVSAGVALPAGPEDIPSDPSPGGETAAPEAVPPNGPPQAPGSSTSVPPTDE